MKYHTFVVILFIALFFLGENVYVNIGLPVSYSVYSKILIFYSLFLLFIKRYSKCFHVLYKSWSIACSIILLRLYKTGIDGVGNLFVLIGGPIIIFSVFYYIFNNRRYIFTTTAINKLFIAFYCVECILAICERAFGTTLFGWSVQDGSVMKSMGDGVNFRSTAMMGHPLQNALMVSTMMGFILFSEMRLKKKITLWIIGYFAIICFNTRSSMVGNAIVLIGYFFYIIIHGSKSVSRKNIFFVGSLLTFGIFVILTKTSLGGRLITMGLFDESSAQVRINAWSIFDYYNMNDFLWGYHVDDARYYLDSIGIGSTENFWIDWLLQYGLITLLLFVILIVSLLYKMYKGYSRVAIVGSASSFWLIASTNNSLSASFLPLTLFLLCLLIFSPYTLIKQNR